MKYKFKRIIKDVLGLDDEGKLSRSAWLSSVYSRPRQTNDIEDVMVSLTTIPSRIDRVHVSIESILRQSIRPVRVVLWLSDRSFPDINQLPTPLIKQMERGLEIHQCDTDWPHQKLLPSLNKWPNATIVTADDDIIYPVDWLEDLCSVYKQNPNTIVCRRARVMALDQAGGFAKYETWSLKGRQLTYPSHLIFPTGVNGTLYPPGVLHDDVHDLRQAEILCPKADDIWFKVMAFRKGTKCIATSSGTDELPAIQGSQAIALQYVNVSGGKNDAQLNAVLKYYNIIPQDFNK